MGGNDVRGSTPLFGGDEQVFFAAQGVETATDNLVSARDGDKGEGTYHLSVIHGTLVEVLCLLRRHHLMNGNLARG